MSLPWIPATMNSASFSRLPRILWMIVFPCVQLNSTPVTNRRLLRKLKSASKPGRTVTPICIDCIATKWWSSVNQRARRRFYQDSISHIMMHDINPKSGGTVSNCCLVFQSPPAPLSSITVNGSVFWDKTLAEAINESFSKVKFYKFD